MIAPGWRYSLDLITDEKVLYQVKRMTEFDETLGLLLTSLFLFLPSIEYPADGPADIPSGERLQDAVTDSLFEGRLLSDRFAESGRDDDR